MTTPSQPGWYDDPNEPKAQRYWDGQDWTPRRQRKPASPSPQQQTPPPLPPQQAPAPPPSALPSALPPPPTNPVSNVSSPPPPNQQASWSPPKGPSGRSKVVFVAAGLALVVAGGLAILLVGGGGTSSPSDNGGRTAVGPSGPSDNGGQTGVGTSSSGGGGSSKSPYQQHKEDVEAAIVCRNIEIGDFYSEMDQIRTNLNMSTADAISFVNRVASQQCPEVLEKSHDPNPVP